MSDGTTSLVLYPFHTAIGGFFEFPTANAQRILPPFLQPVETRHGSSLLSVMAFDFHDSLVGDYGELILSIPVAPRLEKGKPLPRSAFYPFLISTTTRIAREHAIERWHLPHFMDDVPLEFTKGDRHIEVSASHGGSPILRMRITDYAWEPVEHRYQAFMNDADGAYMATIVMNAQFSEHEEEHGTLDLAPHEFTRALDLKLVSTTPFREMWMRNGIQTFHPLLKIARAGD